MSSHGVKGKFECLYLCIIRNQKYMMRPKMTWKQLTERDCREWKLSALSPHVRNMWRSGVRSVMRAASQLSGRGPTDMVVAPVPAC